MATETLLPTSDESSTGSITYSSGATAYNLLDDNDGDTNYIDFTSDGFVSMNYSDMSAIPVTINSVTITASARMVGAPANEQLRLFLKIGVTKYYGSYQDIDVSAFPNTYTGSWTVNPATGEAFTGPEMNAIVAGVEASGWSGNNIRFSYLPIEVDYYGVQATLTATRHVASLDLWLKRRSVSRARFVGNLDSLDVALGGSVSLEHIAGPHATGSGWEDEPWQREMFVVHGHTIDLNALTVTTDLWHQRPFLALVWWLAWSDKASGSIEDGIARFCTPGASLSYTRAASTTFTNPVGESETVPANVPPYEAEGLQIGSDARVYFTNNSGARTFNSAQGTFQCEVRFGALSGARNATVFYVYHDASNYAWLYYDHSNTRWIFRLRVAGSNTDAVAITTPSTGVWYQVGVRWTGSNEENDATAFTQSIYIDRVKYTDTTAAAAMTEAGTSTFDIGQQAAIGTNYLDGKIRKIHSLPIVLTDVEMTRPL